MRKRYFRKPNSFRGKISILKNRFFWLGIFIVAVSIGFFYLICFHDFFQVDKIVVSKTSDQNKVSGEEIKYGVDQEIERKILFLPSKSIFLINNGKIRENILANFPKITEVKISKEFPDALHILVEERLEIGYWCQAEQCFLLDREGVIFEEIIGEVPGNMLKIKNGFASPKLGQRVIEEAIMSQILKIKADMGQQLKILAAEVQVVSEQRLNIKTSEGWEMYINPSRDIDWQITKASLVLEKEIPPEKREELEYIELRFEGLAPFKFRDQGM